MHKIDPIIITLIHNKLTHHHILLIHNSHHLSTLMSHRHISHNTRQLLVHLLIVLILQSCWLYKKCQEKLDMERNQVEKQKEKRKRMKEEGEQRKEDRK